MTKSEFKKIREILVSPDIEARALAKSLCFTDEQFVKDNDIDTTCDIYRFATGPYRNMLTFYTPEKHWRLELDLKFENDK